MSRRPATCPPSVPVTATEHVSLLQGLRNVASFVIAGAYAVVLFMLGRWPEPPGQAGGEDL